jgi:hypothetical protein
MREGARCRDAIRVGPAWLQQHGCEFVTDVKLEAKDGGHANAKRGERSTVFRSWPRLGEGEYIRDKYATWEVAI